MCIAVSEEIDPIDTDAAFWSLAYRSDPGTPGEPRREPRMARGGAR